MLGRFIQDSAVLFATIDPIGSVLVFVAVTQGRSEAQRRRIALKPVLIAGAILVAFMVLGEVLLASMRVGLRSFQIAGGGAPGLGPVVAADSFLSRVGI